MSYSTFTSTKYCGYCGDAFEVKDTKSAGRLCSVCNYNRADIDAIRDTTPYEQMTMEQKARVADRASRRGSRGNGTHFNIKAAEKEAGR